MNERRQLKFADVAKVTGWLCANYKPGTTITRSKLAKAIKKGTGVAVTKISLKAFAEGSGLVLVREPTNVPNFSQTAKLAKFVVDLYEKCGEEVPHDLLRMAGGAERPVESGNDDND